MTAHGAAMVGASDWPAAVMWFFLRKYVRLGLAMFAANYALFMLGAVRHPRLGLRRQVRRRLDLPVPVAGAIDEHVERNAAALFMLGYLLIGVGFLLFYLDAMLGVIRVYGNLGRALGLPGCSAARSTSRTRPPWWPADGDHHQLLGILAAPWCW